MHRHAYWPHIDGLRAIAVLAVVLYHLDSQLLPGGFAGVDVFFVISGYVVTNAALSRSGLPPASFMADFLARRCRRVLPALVVCLLVTSLASALWIPASWLSESIPQTVRAAFFGFGNVVLARNANDYFSPVASYNPFTHTWSLGVEEQFYVLVPLLIWGWMRGGRWRQISVIAMIVAAASSFVYASELGQEADGSAYYLLATRFWELAAGVGLCWATAKDGAKRWLAFQVRWVETSICLLALAALAYAFTGNPNDGLPGQGAWLPIVGTSLLLGILQGTSELQPVKRLLCLRPLRGLGKLSYSLYLWHWPVIVLFRWTVGLDGMVRMLLAATLSFALAWLSWRFIETPFRRPGGFRPAWQVIGVGLVAVVIGAYAAGALHKQQHRISPSAVAKARHDWYPSRAQKLTTLDGCAVSPKRTDLASGWYQTFARQGCPTTASAPRVFVIGDSHALAYGPLFARYAMETGAEVTVYNNAGCPLLSMQPGRENAGQCPEAIATAMSHMLSRLGPSDIVFLPSLRLPRFVEQGWSLPVKAMASENEDATAASDRDRMMHSAAQTLRQLRDTGARVVIQAPNLLMKAPAFRCADWWTNDNPLCTAGVAIEKDEFETLRAPVLAMLDALASTDDGVAIFDPVPSLCPEGGLCSGFRDGRPLFFDGDHLSAYGNQVVYPAFLEAIQPESRSPNAGAVRSH